MSSEPDHQSEESDRGKPRLFIRLASVVLSLLAFLVVSELVLGFYEEDLYREGSFFPGGGDRDFYQVFERDSGRFWRFRANSETASTEFPGLVYAFNSSGFRGPEVFEQKPDYRIIALGNSCTFGWGIPLAQTWTQRLNQKLSAYFPDSKQEVINAGVPGYTSFQGQKYLSDKLMALEPDAVIITFGWNDHWAANNGKPDSEQELPGQALLSLQNILSRMNLYSLIRKIIIGYNSKPEERPISEIPGVRRVPIPEFVSIMTDMIDSLNQHSIQPLLVVPPVASPEEYFGGQKYAIHILHEAYQEEIRLLAARTGTPIVDLQPLFDQYQNLFPGDPIHYSDEGHELAATAIQELLLELRYASEE